MDDRSSATPEIAAICRVPPAEMADLLALDSESSFAGAPTDSSSNAASLSSTPPTSVSDSISLASEPQKPEIETVIALLEQPSIISVPGADAERATPLIDAVRSQTPCQEPTPTRPRRSRASAPVYNIAKLSGTDRHARRRSKGDVVRDGPRGTVLASQAAIDAVFVAPEPAEENEIVVEHLGDTTNDAATSLDRDWSVDRLNTPKSVRTQPRRETAKSASRIATRKSIKTSTPEISRRSTRLSGPVTESLATQLANMGKRARKAFEQTHPTILRELKRLADTKEFAKVEDEPVLQTVWRNGKFYDPRVAAAEEKAKAEAAKQAKAELEKQASLDAQEDLSRKKAQAQADADAADASAKLERRPKKWLEKGLYAGQDAPRDPLAGLSGADKKLLSQLPEFSEPVLSNTALPFPMFGGLRLLLGGRDFKLPFDVCHPLMDQPKPKEWRKITKSRFVGDSLSYWKKNTYYDRSVCVCTPADGCGEHCLNRSVLYECNEGNCNVGRELCKNRAFQDLQDRTKTGGSYRVGVEVYHTGDRGFGVRANRCFEPGQIIMEYAGEIITEEECDRRMNEVYKDKQCYYLMSFDQNMILDATTGSIARFVNHSCSPNCRMIKWIVSGVPRMALFAGDRQIQTGDELTYDYNFDPFSAKNVQKCLCGSNNCRGVLGPKTRNDNAKKAAAAAAAAAKDSVGAKVKAGKRKIKELLSAPGDDESETASMKKRKLQAGEGLKRSLSSASLKVTQGAAKLKRSVSSITVTTTKAAVALMTGSSSASTSGTPRSGKGSIKKSVTRRASTSTLLSKVMKNKGSPRSKAKTSSASSVGKRNSAPVLKNSETIVAATPTGGKGRATKAKTPSSRRKSGKGEIEVRVREPAAGSPRSRKPSAKALAAAADEINVASSALRPTSGGGVKKNRKTTSPSAKTKAVASKLTRTKSMRQTLVSAFSGARKTTGSWRRKSTRSTVSEEDAYAIPSTPEPEEADHEPAQMPRSPPAAGRSGIDIRARYAQVRLVPKDDDE
ncbi:hypothetical protein GGTG_04964 [Gaeumannomyces tritici R3-111a-1]|uniref:Histone-lysine N-methyltransferase n=1 Tax=Gaeumannomyces tritici (strain R3-111a-1) TaxID=644352 RepID=J3NUK8_GAET3|nr:hypothetical protein GGTG_04964 [Gaeumannomyces tritici R3-111a-1]EJT79881.1 hypothetical protein GGTG_04964 [Gaeumannomyces tritici R3-111a-1]